MRITFTKHEVDAILRERAREASPYDNDLTIDYRQGEDVGIDHPFDVVVLEQKSK